MLLLGCMVDPKYNKEMKLTQNMLIKLSDEKYQDLIQICNSLIYSGERRIEDLGKGK